MKEMDAHQIDETILAFGINKLFGEILYLLTMLASFVPKCLQMDALQPKCGLQLGNSMSRLSSVELLQWGNSQS